MADVHPTRPASYPANRLVRILTIAASGLSAAAMTAQVAVKIVQVGSKSKQERAGIEGAVKLTLAVTVVKAFPAVLKEIRTLSKELRKR